MKKIILALAVAAVATMAVVSSASADVARTQLATGLTVTATLGSAVYVHNYTLVTSCDGTFTGTAAPGSVTAGETVSGSFDGSNINIAGVYPNSYSWSYSGPLSGGIATDSLGQQGVSLAFAVATTNYKNHGDYVSQTGGDDAAHSCVGMPVR